MSISTEKVDQFKTIRDMWAAGARQQDIADELGKSLGAVRGALRYNGYKFARGGKIVPIHQTGLPFDEFIKQAA